MLLCPTLCDPMDCSPPGSSVHGILQARILAWVAMPSSSGPSPPRERTRISCLPHWQADALPLSHLVAKSLAYSRKFPVDEFLEAGFLALAHVNCQASVWPLQGGHRPHQPGPGSSWSREALGSLESLAPTMPLESRTVLSSWGDLASRSATPCLANSYIFTPKTTEPA